MKSRLSWKRRLSHTWTLSAGLLLIMVIAGCQSAEVDSQQESVTVETQQAEIGDLTGERIVNATTQSLSEVSLTPELTADVTEVLVEEGEQVEQGQVLARLDDSSLRNALEQERAALRAAQSNVAVSEAGERGAAAGVEQQQAQLESADHSIRQAKEQLNRAQIDLEQARENRGDEIENAEQALQTAERNLQTAQNERDRSQQLYDEGLISEQELENAENAVEDARDSVTEAENSLEQTKQEYNIEQLQSQVETARSNLQQARDSKKEIRAGIESSNASVDEAQGNTENAQASVEQQRQAVQQAEDNLQDAVVTAPSSGRVLTVAVNPGEYYSQQDAMITIGEMNTLNATAAVTEEQLSSFEEGTEMDVRFPSIEQTRTGTVTYIADSSNDNGLFNVEVQVENPNGELRSGIYAEILLYETYVSDGLLVPTSSVIDVDGESSVFIREENQAKLVPVEVVREESDLTAIEADIEAGTPVITRGQYFLEDGASVQSPQEAEESSQDSSGDSGSSEEGDAGGTEEENTESNEENEESDADSSSEEAASVAPRNGGMTS
ncbi:efflux RND transporter periplasmic adaptor subunit [Salibacterium lacus]|uniref:Efflux RND transporter periplasmic adaptor subunit n=1 Tax=Salibacterium lacus TaxID=1898109 RepID=A0ABW5T1N5_9BACI